MDLFCIMQLTRLTITTKKSFTPDQSFSTSGSINSSGISSGWFSQAVSQAFNP